MASPKLRIIDFFMDNPLSNFTKEIMGALGMSKQTFYKYDDLADMGMIKVNRERRKGQALQD